MKSRVCIIRSNPVRPDSRVEKEAWVLARAGYQVHILAWDRDSNHGEEPGTVEVAGVGIPITRLGYKAAYGAGLRSLKPFLRFQFHMRSWLRRHRNEYDIIHACDFDTAFFSIRFAKGKRYVFDIFDFLCGEPSTLPEKLIRKAQISIVNKADATIICTEEREKQIHGSHPRRLAVIHNTPSSEQMNTQSGLVFQSNSSRPKIAYVGILAEERMLSAMGNCLSHHPEVELHLAGFGPLEPLFTSLSASCDNIFYYGRISYDQALELEQKCDIMTAIYDPSVENCRRAAPNKFYESLMLGKPLIMAKGTGMSAIVAENNIGELIEFSEKGFEDGLERLLSRRPEWPEMGRRMKTIYQEQFSWDKMQERLLKLYVDLESEQKQP